jgi:hypothetical protein
MNSKKIFQLWYYNDLLDNNIKYEDLKIYCKNNNLILDNMLRTLPDYPNEKRRNGSYRGYHIIEVKNNNIENINKVTEDKKEIDFIKGRIRAEKIIHLNVENINERDILREFNLDIKEWQIEKLNYSLWDSPNKEKGSIPLYSVKCSFKRRDNLDYDIESLKNVIDNVLSVKNENRKIKRFENIYDRTLLINIADLHLNKYSSDYNINEAKDRYSKALDFFISESNAEQCILIVGEDFFNIDTINKTTTRGTPQDTEVDVYKMFEEGLSFLKDKINLLSYNFSWVKVILVQGNHDKLLSYALVKALEQCDYTDNNVEFDSNVSNRKYITIGNSLIGLGHLDNENKKQKPFLMQNEVKEKYGKSKYNYFISGHFHNYSVEDIGGIQYIRLPSLSGKDNWHDEVGFITSNKSAMALEFDKEKGLVNKIIYNM